MSDEPDVAPILAATGVPVRPMREALADDPADAQDRLHARSYVPGVLLRLILGLFWIVSELVALSPSGFAAARQTAITAGLTPDVAGIAVFLAATVDIALGIPILIGLWVRQVALLQAAAATIYVVVLGSLVPALWLDPLGPLVKVVPAVFAALLIAALAERR